MAIAEWPVWGQRLAGPGPRDLVATGGPFRSPLPPHRQRRRPQQPISHPLHIGHDRKVLRYGQASTDDFRQLIGPCAKSLLTSVQGRL
ncbi:hypothetical protein VTK26DRAFT_2521 [Humicola hyalothermophila]